MTFPPISFNMPPPTAPRAQARVALRVHDDHTARHKEPAPACRVGCAACCHQTTLVTAQEVLLIAAHLRQARPRHKRAALQATLAAAGQRALSLPVRENYGHPCVFLDEDKRCSIYDVRPLACRGLAAMDAAACHATPGTLALYRSDHLELAGALRERLEASQSPRAHAGRLELQSGVAIALSLPDAEARYARGEAVFAGAQATWPFEDLTPPPPAAAIP